MEILVHPLPSAYLWERDEKFWFAHGDVVLSAQLTETTRKLYRVDRLKISAESRLLHDTLFNALPHENTETYEGLPLFHIMDAALDVESVLTYVYDAQNLQISPYDNDTCMSYSTLLRISKNYRMDSLHTELDTHLEFVWPSTLEDWDQRSLRYEDITSHHSGTPNGDGLVDGRYLDDVLAEPAFALRLFRDHDFLKHLPAAFYELSLITPTASWRAMHETPHRESARSRRLLSNRIRSARWDLLTVEDHMCLHKGFRSMQILSLTAIPPDDELCSTPACIHARLYMQLVILHEISRFRDVLGVLRRYCQEEDRRRMLEEGVCAECLQKIVDFMRAKRQYIFDNLWQLFVLPDPRVDTA